MRKLILTAVIAVLVAGGLGFYGGMLYGKRVPARQGMRTGMNVNGGQFDGRGSGGRGGARPGMGGGLVVGEVLTANATSVTVKLRDGGSRIVLLSSTTKVLKATEGSLTDLATGTTVTVQGSQNADGSITAESIQLR